VATAPGQGAGAELSHLATRPPPPPVHPSERPLKEESLEEGWPVVVEDGGLASYLQEARLPGCQAAKLHCILHPSINVATRRKKSSQVYENVINKQKPICRIQ